VRAFLVTDAKSTKQIGLDEAHYRGLRVIKDCTYIYICECWSDVCVCVCVQYWAVLVGRACAVPWERRTAFSHQKYTPPQRLQPRRRRLYYYIDISSRRRRAGVGREPVVAVAWRRRSRARALTGFLFAVMGLCLLFSRLFPLTIFPQLRRGKWTWGKTQKGKLTVGVKHCLVLM
jgi:hypothetical protein